MIIQPVPMSSKETEDFMLYRSGIANASFLLVFETEEEANRIKEMLDRLLVKGD